MVDPLVSRVVAIPKEREVTVANALPETGTPSGRIGDILRQARLDRNDDLYQIAQYLCIKPAFLIALESSRYDEFPADAYVIGFLRTYASFLGVDGREAVDRYRYEMAGRRKKPVLSMPTPVSEGRAPSGIIMVAVTLVLLLIYALWYGLSSSNRAEVDAQPVLPTIASATSPAVSDSATAATAGLTAPVMAPSNLPSAVPAPAPGIPIMGVPEVLPPVAAPSGEATQPPAKLQKEASSDSKKTYGDANAPSRLVIRATQSSWVMVTDTSGKAIFDHVLKAGDSYRVPDKSGLSLTTGNGSGIVLSLDGSDLPKVASGAPHVVRNIPLDPDRLTSEQDH